MHLESCSITVNLEGFIARIERVNPPGPGPISKTSSLAAMPEYLTILSVIF